MSTKKILPLLFVLAMLMMFLPPALKAGDTITSRVDKLFEEWDRKDSPGCALAVIKNGKIIYKNAYGMADLERGVPLNTASLFDIASTSKQFVACCILLLEEEGKLSLDDNIRKYFPNMPDYGKPVTVRHLVHHTSGVRDYLGLMSLAGMPAENDYPEAQILELICRQKALNFDPGEDHLYSNSGYFLLGEIVKQASGKSCGDYAKEKIFKPLGMNATHFYDDFTRVVKNRALGYFPKSKGVYGNAVFLFDLVGDGGVLTSVEDMFLWDQNFYNNKLGKGGPGLIKKMQTRGKLNNGKTLDYAFGLGINKYKGLNTVRHGGAWAGYRAQLIRFPDQQFSVVCLANLGGFNPDRLVLKVADIYLEKEFKADKKKIDKKKADKKKEKQKDKKAKKSPPEKKPKFITLPEKDIKRKAGLYRSTKTGRTWKILFENKNLVADVGIKVVLKPVSVSSFVAVDAPFKMACTFAPGTKTKPGKAAKKAPATYILHVRINDGEDRVFKQLEPVHLTREQLKAFCGKYYSEELDAVYTLYNEDNKLFYKKKYSTRGRLLDPTAKDEFLGGRWNIKFTRDAQNQLKGFTIGAGRVKGILFEKQKRP